ncbi:MAG: sugar ABC transporter permease [Chloroflexota bacterium]|nr:sugar ABC transporter permease [Chloroflexota bacterium]MDE2854321.1 sugar ABC transporter permease [Chloroflexota bacterium]MDE2947233.1 sugar ABC transporter permease [Chloroflexota bacterium]
MLKKPATWHGRHDVPWLVAFALPAFLIVVAVQFYPLAYSALLSVQEWSLTESQTPQGFVGLDNFRHELGDSTFQRSVRNSVLITGGAVILEMLLGVCLAYMTMGSSWRMRAVRTILIVPMVIAPVAAGTLWRILLNSRAGLVNHLLSLIGVKGPEWLASPDWAIVSVIMLDTWQWTPFVLLVAGAAIASIPTDLLEVAAIDGASRWRTFLHIELPLLMPLLLLTLVFRMLESLLSLDSIYSLTFGGPGFSTYTMTFYIYTQGLRNFNFGAAAASSWMFMLFASLSIWLVFWFQRRDW